MEYMGNPSLDKENMNEAEVNEVGEVRGGGRCGRGGELWILLFAA